MFTLLKTFLDIAVLRKGPDALPASWLVFYIAAGLWLSGIVFMTLVVPEATLVESVPGVAGWAASMLLFAVVIIVAGHAPRLVQALAAIAGAGAVIVFVQVTAMALLSSVGGVRAANFALEVLLLWAVFVKGYIIALTIGIRPIFGVGISLVVYVVRVLVSYSLSPAPG